MATVEKLKLPPHSLQAEQAALGAVLIDPKAWPDVAERASADDFYGREHRLIYRALARLAEQGRPLDPVTVAEELERAGEIDDTGGYLYLHALWTDTPSVANAGAYAGIVCDHATQRQLIQAGGEITERGLEPNGATLQELAELADRRLLAISERLHKPGEGLQPLKSALVHAVDEIETAFQRDEVLIGAPSGFRDLDELLGGLQPAELLVLAARPSMGKTALAVNIAQTVANKTEKPVAIFSLEMSRSQVVKRMLSACSCVDLSRLMRGTLEPDEWPHLTAAVSMLTGTPQLHIDDSSALSALDIHSRCERLRRTKGLGLVVVDYLGLMAGEGETQALKIGANAAAMKRLAKDLSVPVLLLAQLNRQLEQRPNKRPIMADLRDFGEIEQHADQVWMIYRDEVYNESTDHKGIAELLIRKNRNGPIGTVRLMFHAEQTRFADLAPTRPEYR